MLKVDAEDSEVVWEDEPVLMDLAAENDVSTEDLEKKQIKQNWNKDWR